MSASAVPNPSPSPSASPSSASALPHTHSQTAAATYPAPQLHDSVEKTQSRTKLYAILGGIGALILLVAIVVGLYLLGGDDQSALERLRDVAVIFIVLLAFVIVVLLAAITAALAYLTLQIKDRVIPALEEVSGTAKRVHTTTKFVTEEAVKPIVSVASSYARLRAMSRTVIKGKNPPKPKADQRAK